MLSKIKAEFKKDGINRYLKSIKWTTLARVLTMSISLLTTVILARILGPVSFGALSYVLSTVGILGILAALGIDNVVFKKITERKHDREEILSSAILLKIISGVFTFLLLTTLTLMSNETLYIKKLIIIFGLSFITQPLLLLSYDFLKDSESKYVTITQVVTILISSSLKILIVYKTASLLGFIAILVIENIIAGFIYLYQIKKIRKLSFNFNPNKKEMLNILLVSAPLVLFSAFSEIYYKIDQVMLKHYLDVSAVGVYAAAVRLSEIWFFVPNILMVSLFPAFINSQNNKEEYAKRLKYFMVILLTLGSLISILNIFFSELIVKLVYGKEFIESSKILSIYTLSIISSFLSFVIYQDLFIKNKKKLLLLIPFLTMILNIWLNTVLIPSHGTAGAAWATVISYSFIPLLYFSFKNDKILS